MEAFRYESGQLLCENVPVESLAERFGTPAYVYSQAAILGNFSRLKQSLGLVPNLICYSVKANSNLRILNLLRQAGAGFDVVSGGELARALRAGALADHIVFSGVGKTEEEIDAGLSAGIGMFNVESAGELELIDSRACASPSVLTPRSRRERTLTFPPARSFTSLASRRTKPWIFTAAPPDRATWRFTAWLATSDHKSSK
jgi:diaminopimelate decarboxylase